MNENVLTLGDLIKKKDYDCISVRITSPPSIAERKPDMFLGFCHSKNGELISDDGDCYSKEEVVLSYEEWSNPAKKIENGLTVVIPGGWR